MLIFQTLIVAMITIRTMSSVGTKVGLLDTPGTRKQHLGNVPLTGGIAVFLTFLFGTFAFSVAPLTYPMLIIACAVCAIGVCDDFRRVKATTRLMFGFLSGILLATYGNIAIVSVGNLLALGTIPLLLLSVPLTSLAVAGLSNAYNMVDGIDGLAATTIALPLLVLYVLALQAGHPMAHTLSLMLVPLLVFLLFNLGPNNTLLPKVFLGDAGSVTQGFLVTASLVYFSQGENALIRPVTALWLVAVPLMDMLATMLRRYRYRRSVMQADRSHLHYTLMDNGFSARQSLLLILVYAILCAVTGLLLEYVPEYLSLLCYFLLFCCHCVCVIKYGAP